MTNDPFAVPVKDGFIFPYGRDRHIPTLKYVLVGDSIRVIYGRPIRGW